MTRQQRWIVNALATAREAVGGYCQNVACPFMNWDLQFAHLRPTGVVGRGRGSSVRARDIRRNPSAYALLCRECHRAFDAGEELVLTIREEMAP